MKVTTTTAGDTLIAALSGEIDHHSAKAAREEIDAALNRQRPARLEIDFGGVSFMDSSGIGLVMGRYRLARALGAATSVTHLSPQFGRVMRLAGLDRLVSMEDGGESK